MNQQPPPVIPCPSSGTASSPNPNGRRFSTLAGSAAQTSALQPGAAIAGDLLYGADAIALFLFGDRRYRRRVYNLVDGNGLPVFRVGVNICARKSVLLAWIDAQESGTEKPAV